MRHFIWVCFLAGLSAAVTASTVSDFALLDHAGNYHKLSNYQDHDAVVIIAQDNDDALLLKAVTELSQIQTQFKDKKVAILLLNTNPTNSRESISDIVAKYAISFPVLYDPSELVAEMLDIKTTNTAYLIDIKSRKVRYFGPINEDFALNVNKADGYLREAINNLAKEIPDTVDGGDVKGKNIDFVEHKDYSYHQNIAPILKRRCAECHREGGVGPWAMNSYEMIRGWAPMIRETVMTRRMPPGQFDEHYGAFKVVNRLSVDEKRSLVHWIDAGAQRGKGEDPLQNLEWASGKWTLGTPDKIIDIPSQEIPATGIVDYRYAVVDVGIDRDVWVKGIEAKPGNPAVTHHITSTLILPAGKMHRPGENAFLRRRLVTYVPGRQPTVLPEDSGKFIPKGSKILFEMHYTTTGKEATDASQIALYYADEVPKYEIYSDAAMDWKFNIPPQKSNHQVSARAEIIADSLLHTLTPHMHFRGKSMKYTARFPDGRKQVLLSVPNYQFNWQFQYDFKEPIFLPVGTEILVDGSFDNSKHNEFNPDPGRWVSYGNQSRDEMFFGFFAYHYTDISTHRYFNKSKAIILDEGNLDQLSGSWYWRTGPNVINVVGTSNDGQLVGSYYFVISEEKLAFGETGQAKAKLNDGRLNISYDEGDVSLDLGLYLDNNKKPYLYGARKTIQGQSYEVTFFKQ